MIGRDPALIITLDDDLFHSPTSDDPRWLETAWFPFYVAEAGLSVSLRLWFSANRKLQGGACVVWRGENDILHSDRWLEEMTASPDLTAVVLPGRLQLQQQVPLQRFAIDYARDGVSFNVTFDATMAPNPVDPAESPGMFDGHFEQPGHVTGDVCVSGDNHTVDCHSLRDRSWGPREMQEGMRLGNAYGGCAGTAFFTYIQPDAAGVEHITGGFLKTPEGEAAIVRGLRTTTWRDGWPTAVTLQAQDALGRTLDLKGQCRNRFASNAGHGIYGILNLVQWRGESLSLWGENHDIWSEKDWLGAGRPAIE